MIEDDYQAAFGEPAVRTLDLDTWVSGEDLPSLYNALEREVQEAVEVEEGRRAHIRSNLFPKLHNLAYAAPDAGFYRFTPQSIEKAHRGFLFNGAVEASDGTIAIHDTLPVTITQVGVCLVSYNGASGSYAHRLFRKDLHTLNGNSVNELLEMLRRRRNRGATGTEEDEPYSNLFMRGVMAWAERAFLLERSDTRWRMGHGNPTPYELLTKFWTRRPELVDASLNLMRGLVEHRRFVYVPSTTSEREMLALGYALRPLEYLILTTHADYFSRIIESGRYYSDSLKKLETFARDVGPQIVRGVYRVSRDAPPYLFYAHQEYAHEAALIAMADSALQMHRGFPMLIDLADRLCRATFGSDDFLASVRLAYSGTGKPYSYMGERETRT